MSKAENISFIIDQNHGVLEGHLNVRVGGRSTLVETVIPRPAPDAPRLPDDYRAEALSSIQEQFVAQLEDSSGMSGIPPQHRDHFIEVFRILQGCIIALKKYRIQVEAHAERAMNAQERADAGVVISGINMVISLVKFVAYGAQLALRMTNSDLK